MGIASKLSLKPQLSLGVEYEWQTQDPVASQTLFLGSLLVVLPESEATVALVLVLKVVSFLS